MAQQQGYTRIDNDKLEALAKLKLNGTQRRIIDVIFRYTSGFNRESHIFSISFICVAMGLDKKNDKQIRRELEKLIRMNILTEVKSPTKNSARARH
ncbi:MAG: replication protein [Desulfitobacterium sp.]